MNQQHSTVTAAEPRPWTTHDLTRWGRFQRDSWMDAAREWFNGDLPGRAERVLALLGEAEKYPLSKQQQAEAANMRKELGGG